MNGLPRSFFLLMLILSLLILPIGAPLYQVGPEATYAPYVDQKVTHHGMYLAIDNTTQPTSPVELTDTYTDLDSQVIQFLDVVGIKDGDIVEWKFQSPEGAIVSDMTIKNRFQGNFTKTVLYCRQPIRYFLSQTGQWSVTFSINGKDLASDTFTVLLAPKTSVSSTPGGTLIPEGTPTSGETSNTSALSPGDQPGEGLPVIPILLLFICIVVAGGIGVALRSRGTLSGASSPTVSPTQVSFDSGIPHDVFISYSHVDKPVADAICNTLEAKQIRCWMAPRDVLPGINYQEAIIDAINTTRIMVLVFSSHSNTSPHVIRELTKALTNEVVIIPFRIEDAPLSKSMEYIISIPHWLDAVTPPLEKHLDELARYVETLLQQMKPKG
jgi:hypothetical protein